MFKTLKGFWKDERGSILTTENIGYTLLIGGAVALVGFGMTALARGKTSAIFNATKATKAMGGNVTDSSAYTYGSTVDTNTGMQTGAAGN